jgi:hypothetical protein
VYLTDLRLQGHLTGSTFAIELANRLVGES